MCVIYTWMRRLDDLADDAPSAEMARKSLDVWREQTHRVMVGGVVKGGELCPELWPAFHEVVSRYDIPLAYFDEIIEGACMDQEVLRYETFEELYRYCYRVASVVGLVTLRVFGYDDSRAEKTGEWLGIAFQLTNILRDVREDASRKRIYLPLTELRERGLSAEDVLALRWSPGMKDYLRMFADRAEEYYQKALPVVDFASRDARPTLRIMEEIYHGLLRCIRASDYNVFQHRASLPKWKKLFIVFKHQLLREAS